MMFLLFCLGFLQALWSFFITPSLLSQGSISLLLLSFSLQPSASHLGIFLYFYNASVPFCLTLIHFHRLPPPAQFHSSTLSLLFSTASSLPASQFLWSRASVQFLFPSYTPPLFSSAVCILQSLFPWLVKNSIYTWLLWCSRALEWLFLLFSWRASGLQCVCVSQMTPTLSWIWKHVVNVWKRCVLPILFSSPFCKDLCPHWTIGDLLNLFFFVVFRLPNNKTGERQDGFCWAELINPALCDHLYSMLCYFSHSVVGPLCSPFFTDHSTQTCVTHRLCKKHGWRAATSSRCTKWRKNIWDWFWKLVI